MIASYLYLPNVFLYLIKAMIISQSIYRLSEKHINKKMKRASMQLYYADVEGDYIEFWDNNNSKPILVLVHGFGASTKYQWYKQIEWLSKEFRIIMPNLLHFGKTKPGTEKYRLADQVEMVHDLIEHLGIEEYSICGVSYGGLITAELAAKYPKGIQRIVAFDAPIKYIHQQDIFNVCQRFNVASIEELFVPRDAKGLKKLLYLATLKNPLLPSSWLKEFYNELYGYNLQDKIKLISSLLDDMGEYTTHKYPLKMPVLLIWGSNDPIIPAKRGQMLANHIGENARLVIIDSGAHLPNFAKTRKFDSVLREFLVY